MNHPLLQWSTVVGVSEGILLVCPTGEGLDCPFKMLTLHKLFWRRRHRLSLQPGCHLKTSNYRHDSRYSPPFQNINPVPLEILQQADMILTGNPDSVILLHTIHTHSSSANINCAKAIWSGWGMSPQQDGEFGGPSQTILLKSVLK